MGNTPSFSGSTPGREVLGTFRIGSDNLSLKLEHARTPLGSVLADSSLDPVTNDLPAGIGFGVTLAEDALDAAAQSFGFRGGLVAGFSVDVEVVEDGVVKVNVGAAAFVMGEAELTFDFRDGPSLRERPLNPT